MRFSERIGKKPVRCNLQVDSMDDELRNGLWNAVFRFILEQIRERGSSHEIDLDQRPFLTEIWDKFFRWKVDEITWFSADTFVDKVKQWFFAAEWHQIFDLVEFIAQVLKTAAYDYDKAVRFKYACNQVLEKELSAYRFVGDKITPITNKVEVSEVNEALDLAEKNALKGVGTHLESALEKLSDRKNPDYRNSIKESISAVESLCVIISGDLKATLGQALKKVKDAVGLHPALERGFSAIYGYTSDADGIRHFMIEESTCDFDDAKYMLVSCSAFVNYLIGKASKAGLIK